MLDIDALRLSDEEITKCFQVLPPSEGVMADVVDAQLRKAVKGIADWLDGLENDLLIPAHFGKYLREAAGIPKERE